MEFAKAQSCETHTHQFLSFLCLQKGCNAVLCSECLFQHCKEHEKNKTFPEIKLAEIFRQDLSERISVLLRKLYQELDDMSLSSSEKILKALDNAEEEVIEIVRIFFKEKRKQALDEVQAIQQASTEDIASSQVKSRFQEKTMKYEELNNVLNEVNVDIKRLQELSKKDFDSELGELLEEISTQTNPLKLWKSDNLHSGLKKLLESSFMIGKAMVGSLVFPPDKRDSDIEIVPGNQMVIRKKGETTNPSICLGPCLNKGVHSFSVSIDVLAGQNGGFNGWVGLGFIDNDGINLKTNNYSSAVCICSDQSFYKVHVSQSGQITVGNTYHFEANFDTGVINITGDNGLAAKAEGYQGKNLFPYFELTHKHQITFFNYKKMK